MDRTCGSSDRRDRAAEFGASAMARSPSDEEGVDHQSPRAVCDKGTVPTTAGGVGAARRRPLSRSSRLRRLRPCQRRRSTGSAFRSEEHTSELQSQSNLVCRLLLEKKKNISL